MKKTIVDTNKSLYFHHDKNVKFGPETTLREHYHDNFEIYLITEGNCTYFIDKKTYQLREGDLILIPPGVIHNNKYTDSAHSRMLLHCSTGHIPSSVRKLLPSMLYLYRNPEILNQIYDIFYNIENEYQNRDNLSDDILYCNIQMLFLLLAKNRSTCTSVESGNELISRAISYVQANYLSDISLVEMADFCSVSPEHFSRTFKKETGFGFNKYLNLLRLQNAEAEFRKNPNASVTQVALSCGFRDSNYFSVKFKELYDISPKKFQRAMLLKKLDNSQD